MTPKRAIFDMIFLTIFPKFQNSYWKSDFAPVAIKWSKLAQISNMSPFLTSTKAELPENGVVYKI